MGLDRCGRGRAGVDSDVRAGGNDTEKEVQIVCDNRKQRAYKNVDLGLSHPPNYQSPSLPSACLNLVQEDTDKAMTQFLTLIITVVLFKLTNAFLHTLLCPVCTKNRF